MSNVTKKIILFCYAFVKVKINGILKLDEAVKCRSFNISWDVNRECEYRVSYGNTLKLSGRRHLCAFYVCYVKRYHVRSLGTNVNVEYKIIKFFAYYETAKLTWEQSD